MALPTQGGVFFQGNVNAAGFNGVTEYVALISQASTSAPTVKVLRNTLSAAIVWTRTSAGVYVGTLASEFTADKTFIHVTGNTNGLVSATRASANAVNIFTYDDTFASADALLTDASLKISIYP